MKKLFLSLISILVVVGIFIAPAIVFAATTADITVTTTPTYISIESDHASNDFRTVTASTNSSTTQGHITITNTSTVATNVSIKVTGATWTGGAPWTHSKTAIPGADTAGLVASNNTGNFDVIVKAAAAFNNIFSNLPATTNFTFELRLVTPTSFGDGVQKTNTVRLTAAAV